MNIIEIILLLFALLEITNVNTLYFDHSTTKANGMGAFTALSKERDSQTQNMLDYLIYWVAWAKMIFILLLIVIIAFADRVTQFFSLIAMILSISLFYWKLYPLIRKMDSNGNIQPNGYSRTLGWMILAMIVVFSLIAIFSINSTFTE